jgi:hypothetical protein
VSENWEHDDVAEQRKPGEPKSHLAAWYGMLLIIAHAVSSISIPKSRERFASLSLSKTRSLKPMSILPDNYISNLT